MAARLSNRLSQLRSIREERGDGKGDGRKSRGGKSENSRAGDSRGDPRRNTLFAQWHRNAPLVLSRKLTLPFPRIEKMGESLKPYGAYGELLLPIGQLEQARFYDFETTGLSGGAGTYIFLAGIGRFRPQALEITQLLLEDYPGEPDFLEALGELIGEDDIAVSYNGKRFDAHVLLTRSRMSGVKLCMGKQLDLLYPARAVWKRALGSCRLSRIEQYVLNRGRSDDIDGALIPECYFTFLREGAMSRGTEECMRRVIDHHLLDIESLAHLLFHIEEASADPQRLELPGAREGLAALLLRKADLRGASILEEELERGSLRAGRTAALYYRSIGMVDAMERVLLRMWERSHDHFQGIALAKLYEHKKREPVMALEIVEELQRRLQFLTEEKRGGLEKRRDRLLKKMGRFYSETREL